MNNPIVKLGPVYKDHRGEIQMIFEKQPFNAAYFIQSKAGKTRASHWHSEDFHFCLVTKGRLEYYERPVGSMEKPKKYSVKKGEMVYTAPKMEHEMYFPVDTELYCFSGSSRKRDDYEEDTTRFDYSLRKIFNE